jgi:hypothetical protein
MLQDPPMATTMLRPRRSTSVDCSELISTVLPYSSAMTIGPAGTPKMWYVVICNCGNARPMPSPSTTGNPQRAASTSGSSALTPPISAHSSAFASLPA